jgi:hypothetical protein
MSMKFVLNTYDDVLSGDIHRAIPAALNFGLRLSLAAFIVATFVPMIYPNAGSEFAFVGGALIASITSFFKFSLS